MKHLIYAAGLCLLTLTSTVLAGAQTVRSLVPDDAGLYVEAVDVADNYDRFMESETWARLKAFPPLKNWYQKNSLGLTFISTEIGRQIGVPTKDLFRKVFGGSVAVAVWPPDEVGSENFPGLLVVEAPDAEVLAKVIDGVNEANRKSGELLNLDEATYGGVTYFVRRVRRDGNESTEYLAAVGNLGLLSNREAVLRTALDLRAKGTKPAGSLAQSPAFQEAVGRGPQEAVLRWFLNPRPWDPFVRQGVQEGIENDPGAAPILRGIGDYWQAMRFWSAFVTLKNGISIDAVIRHDAERMAPGTQAFVASFGGEARFAEMVPQGALAVVSGRMDIGKLGQEFLAILEQQEPEEWSKLRSVSAALLSGLDPVRDVLSRLGPDYGFCIMPAGTDSALPVHWMSGLQIRSGDTTSDEPTTKFAVDEALRTLLRFGAVAHNAENDDHTAVVKTKVENGHRFTWVDGLKNMPPGWTLAYTVSQGYLLAGSSREVLLETLQRPSSESIAAEGREHLVDADGKLPSQVFYVNLRAARELMETHKQQLIDTVSEMKDVEPDVAEKGLRQLHTLLRLCDQVLAVKHISDSGVQVRIRTVVKP